MDALLQIKQSQHEARVPVTVFALAGEIDSSNSEQFQNEVEQAIQAGVRYVALDCSQLRYISSAGVRALFALAKMLSARGEASAAGRPAPGSFKSPYLKLFHLAPVVRQTLDMMGFTMSMEIHKDLEQALASF
jgi:anti-anti-sigma factor